MLRHRHTVLGPLQPRDVQPLLFAPTTPAALHHLPGPLIRRVPPALGAAPRLAPTPAVPCRAPALSFNPLLSPPFQQRSSTGIALVLPGPSRTPELRPQYKHSTYDINGDGDMMHPGHMPLRRGDPSLSMSMPHFPGGGWQRMWSRL
ncbi:hypothetical protein CVT25_007332 [Psilocybe cyanescens]|uniref:Uncharacterized protein n=1 Tax=Psilocybe cyanescens TaxID=93625 RepID=A0A409XJD0_PSICY|nr:hypothetical protein CVT25_007332 [Psilocybe cyanescens]